jgi:hypothetical protein
VLYSNWKLTFDPSGTPQVLLNFGDVLTEEIRFPMAIGLEVVPLPGAAAPYLRPSGNAFCSMTFERLTLPSSLYDKSARSDVLDTLITFAPLGRKPLRIEVYGLTDRYWQFANSAFTLVEPRRVLESSKPRFSQKYQITASVLTKTIIP